ncbi:MAG: S8 family peptidase [Candidatus Koribacter versatilis]|uniref:S8 family peptidase n=1 Tax=Candidatus Korobacter versatilis TaxID=658062 RepID=A0A932AAQ3_9BACT|nr:S8 family peptidase [Candidatus Koribacter versatilis]
MPKRNFLLGEGERLTSAVELSPSGGPKNHPYTLGEAIERLAPEATRVSTYLDGLPDKACPDNEAVAVVTLHPSYIAKSLFPAGLLSDFKLRAIGSKAREIVPQKWGSAKHPKIANTADLFVAGKRSNFKKLADTLNHQSPEIGASPELIKIEEISSFTAQQKMKGVPSTQMPAMEIVLHSSEKPRHQYVLRGFGRYLESLQVTPDFSRQLFADELCFLPMLLPVDKIAAVAEFSFVRVIRELPRLRQLTPVRSYSVPSPRPELPKADAIAKDLSVAVFDGGVPLQPDLTRWVTPIEAPELGPAKYQEHGLGVSSALLFGPLTPGKPLSVPYVSIDHVRVLDTNSDTDPFELYEALKVITERLEKKKYDYVNISVGPNLPIEDHEVHMWTSKLDTIFATQEVLASIAVGNDGESDRASGNARVQTPADCVNAMSVGAATSRALTWKRAPYSSIGPGRAPGVVKPDVLSFGGCDDEPFIVLGPNDGDLLATLGTSFAAPNALRDAIGIRAALGKQVKPLASKALLLHHAKDGGHDRVEVGWGRVPTDLGEMITSDGTSVTVLYQGTLTPARYLRARIPMPPVPMSGMVSVSATFCFTTHTDPSHPFNYTRAGLDILFRPHLQRRRDSKQLHANTKSFFGSSTFHTPEYLLREDAHKWEPTLKATRRLRGTSIKDPVFDIHYNARTAGGGPVNPQKIPYALVITVSAPKMPDIYDRVLHRYRGQLRPMQPLIQIPITT